MNYYQEIVECANAVKKVMKETPKVAIILGSGLGELVDELEDQTEILYQDIPHFPIGNVKGHGGKLVLGTFKGQYVLMMQGRFHYYEGFSMKQVVLPIYLFKQLGIKNLIVTNSCGAINTNYKPGDIVLIEDFINLVFNNPLIGENFDELGPRFPDMSEPYSHHLQEAFQTSNKIQLEKGCYGYFSGPYYETRKEIQAFKILGCDLIGMSTVPETIAANHCGMNVLGISCVTNMATGIQKQKHSHDNVVNVANEIASTLKQYFRTFFENYTF